MTEDTTNRRTRLLRGKRTGTIYMPTTVKHNHLPDYLQNIDLNRTSAGWDCLFGIFDNFFKGDLKSLDDRQRKFLKHFGVMILAVLDSEGSPDLETVDRSMAEVERLWDEWGEEIDREWEGLVRSIQRERRERSRP